MERQALELPQDSRAGVVIGVELYRIPLLDRPEFASFLSEEERARMARFRFSEDRRRYLAAHGALREILARHTGIDPGALRFSEGEHGKPALIGSDIKFNLSHSGEMALIAIGVARDREVGVDIEKIRADIDVLAIAQRFFTAEEAARLESLEQSERTKLFFTLWTRKEALSKARGIPLAEGLADAFVEGYCVEDVDVGEDYAAAAASATP